MKKKFGHKYTIIKEKCGKTRGESKDKLEDLLIKYNFKWKCNLE
jgi:hypothetical protein